MPRVFGKPGSRKYRGLMVAQMQRAKFTLSALLRYNDKKEFLTSQQAVDFDLVVSELTELLAAKNT